jgi:hypothetical protein
VKHSKTLLSVARLAVPLLAVALPGWCGSTVASYSGNIGFVNTPPSSLVPGAVENNLKALLFIEDTDLVFASAITVDATTPGLYKTKTSLTPGSIAAGTRVSSTYLHADPVTSGTTFSGSITFTNDILGVVALAADLSKSDTFLGVSGTNYGTSVTRGFEVNPLQDYFSISSDLRTLNFTAKTWGYTDDLRIITAGTITGTTGAQPAPGTVPEPGTLALIGLGLSAVAVSAHRRRQSTR